MPQEEYVVKIVSQYNAEPLAKEDMDRLLEVAKDYCAVKNEVFDRYSGIRSLGKLYPGYTVQNEMTQSGFRQRLDMPAVYFYLAIFDALGEIKSEWTRLKKQIRHNLNRNESFCAEDKHYLRFVLKSDSLLEAVLNGREEEFAGDFFKSYEALREKVDAKKLNSYLCRQVRRNHRTLRSREADGFAAAERAYRYADHGIYISTKKKRSRVFVPLTDNNCYKRQIYVKLHPQECDLEIRIPVDVKVNRHEDYTNEVGIALGMETMLTTDQGHVYGKQLGEKQTLYTEWIRQQNQAHRQNPDKGRKKYALRKNRYTEVIHSYINQELNLFLTREKPKTIYMTKLPAPSRHGGSKAVNGAVSMWQRGFIRDRLRQKCAEHAVQLVEVLGKDISRTCSRCGKEGKKRAGQFTCDSCGFCADEKKNTAANARKRGQDGQRLNESWPAQKDAE